MFNGNKGNESQKTSKPLFNKVIHPVIRIACFILLITGLANNSLFIWGLLLPLLIILARLEHAETPTFALLKRLRWLFLSIFILHLWFSEAEFSWLPAWQGWLQAMERVGALIFIVLAAHVLLRTTSRTEIIAALQWWLNPLNYLGFATERLAIRLALVLETVEEVQNLYSIQPHEKLPRYSLQTIGQRVAELLNQVAQRAEQAPLYILEIPDALSPPWWQWGYVGMMLLLIFTSPSF